MFGKTVERVLFAGQNLLRTPVTIQVVSSLVEQSKVSDAHARKRRFRFWNRPARYIKPVVRGV